MTLFVPIFIGLAILSTIGVALFRALAQGNVRLMDRPNERSLHSQATVRGGGVVIATIVILAVYLQLSTDGSRVINDALVLLSLLTIAGVGFLDDLFSVSARVRLVVHITSALVFCLALPIFSFEELFAGGWHGSGRLATLVLSALWVSWSTNAFNFMDGADGIAGLQGVVGGLGAVGVGVMLDDPLIIWFGGALAATLSGFLLHNWSPAKIFLGDVGSSFVGFLVGAIPIVALGSGKVGSITEIPFIALGLAWPFYFDATTTLIRRIARSEKIWKPHREHAYQRMILVGSSHASVAFGYGVLSLIPVIFLLIGFYFQSVFEILTGLGLVISTFGLFVLSKHSRMVDGSSGESR